MSVEETILFIAVIALALALVVVVVGPKLRSGRAGKRRRDEAVVGADSGAVTGPAVRATPVESAQPSEEVMVVLPDPPVVVAGSGKPPVPPQAWSPLVCPTCRRQFAAGLRFCPYDARLLAAEPPPGPTALEREPTTDPELRAPTGKICPSCARRYEMVAVVCARDGAPLVSVN